MLFATLNRNARLIATAGPRLAVGDGALGFWNGAVEVYPETAAQRCWFHKMGCHPIERGGSRSNNA
jgi:hypothetical protein